MVIADSRIHIPVGNVNAILNIGSRLDIPLAVRKCESQLRPGFELRRISNDVTQLFTNWVNDAVRPEFPVMMSVVSSQIPPNIAFPISAILGHHHRNG